MAWLIPPLLALGVLIFPVFSDTLAPGKADVWVSRKHTRNPLESVLALSLFFPIPEDFLQSVNPGGFNFQPPLPPRLDQHF